MDGSPISKSASSTPDKTSSQDDANAPAEVTTPADCLTGTWLADNDFFLGSIREFGDQFTDVSGQVTIEFADDGTLTTHYQGWLLSAVVEGSEATIRRDGIDTGTFTVHGDTVSLVDTTVGSALTVSAHGIEMPVDPLPISYTDATLTCTPAVATITTPDGTLRLTR